jgi:hypothetical protein
MGEYRNSAASQDRPSDASKNSSQRDQILRLLSERDAAGVTNLELNEICFRYGARIWELRRKGHSISTKNRGEGVFLFVLEVQPAKPAESERRA